MNRSITKNLPQHILENLNTAVLLVDAELVVRAMNPAGEMLFETGARQAVGQPLRTLLRHNQALLEAIHQTLVSAHPFTEHGLRIGLPLGRWVTVDCAVTPVGGAEILPGRAMNKRFRDTRIVASARGRCEGRSSARGTRRMRRRRIGPEGATR